jgi:hypothetical protein
MLIADDGAVAARNIRVGMIGQESPNSSGSKSLRNALQQTSLEMLSGHISGTS